MKALLIIATPTILAPLVANLLTLWVTEGQARLGGNESLSLLLLGFVVGAAIANELGELN